MQNKFFSMVLFAGLLGISILSGCSKKKGVEPGPGPTGPTVQGGWIHQNETWYAAGNPHIIEGTVHVEGGAIPIVTIEPGVVVKFKPGACLETGECLEIGYPF